MNGFYNKQRKIGTTLSLVSRLRGAPHFREQVHSSKGKAHGRAIEISYRKR